MIPTKNDRNPGCFLIGKFGRLRSRLLPAVFIAGLGIPAVSAAIISQTLSFRLLDGDSSSLSFAPFDPSQGVLENVSVTFSADQRHTWALGNAAPDPAAISYIASLGSSTLMVSDQTNSFGVLNYGRATTPVLTPVSPLAFGAEFLAARAQFNAGATPLFVTAAGFSATTSISGSLGLPLDFAGALPIAFDSGLWTISAVNAFAGSLVDVSGTVTTTYQYRAHPVPDAGPNAWLLLGVGGALLLVHAARRATTSTVAAHSL